ncbi:uncharacterized protein SCHCODRAFT_02494005 [Schizophyllum commune H4-8]|nr:uncharacterized protein SCHCODRAFT_02494005 [Schizophyllum commune H4-8]KAI5895947.1 hypothetical protein SCHCODRAFT_02494005 [Schizophyllum commune H4-8]
MEVEHILQQQGLTHHVLRLRDTRDGILAICGTPLSARVVTRCLQRECDSGIDVRPVQDADRKRHERLTVDGSSIEITVQLPTKILYAGYSNQSLAEQGKAYIESQILIRGHRPRAAEHHRIPAVRNKTLIITGLPHNVTEDEKRTLGAEEYMHQRPNYVSSPRKVRSQLSGYLAHNFEGFLSLELQPEPFIGGMATLFASFSSSDEATRANAVLDGSRPQATGYTQITTRLVCRLWLRISHAEYSRHKEGIDRLVSAAHQTGAVLITVVPKPRERAVLLYMQGTRLEDIADQKQELDKIVRGDVVRSDGRALWDTFFRYPMGKAFLKDLERSYPGLVVTADACRRELRVAGPRALRHYGARDLAAKIDSLKAEQAHLIPLKAIPSKCYIDDVVLPINRAYGPGHVTLDMKGRKLLVRGDIHVQNKVAVAASLVWRKYGQSGTSSGWNTCPVCLSPPADPVTLESQCGHIWCSECMKLYLLSSHERHAFPITCLGDGGSCAAPISVRDALRVLSEQELLGIVEVAFTTHIASRPREFHYCPTPDCDQVYRKGSEPKVVRCPSCLLSICRLCDSEAHGILPCRATAADAQFEEWMQKNGAKRCPGCTAPIQRDQGCNHVTCTRCTTHICWVCMETFPGGDGIYGHMRTEHGSFGVDGY